MRTRRPAVAGGLALLVAVLSACSLLAASPAAGAGATVVRVPGDQPTVQAGLDAVAPGGQVVVAPGVYHERIDFHGKAAEVTAAQGPQATTLDGGHGGAVVSFVSGEGRTSVLRGFTLRNGQGSSITVMNASPTVVGNVLDGGYAPDAGAGIAIAPGSPLIQGNRVTGFGHGGNFGGYGGYGGGLTIQGAGKADVFGNTIDHNTWPNSGGGVAIYGTGEANLRDNVIRDNSAPAQGGGIFILSDARVTIADNLLAGNTAGGQGGGIYLNLRGVDPGPSLVGNTMVANQAPEGSAVFAEGFSLQGIAFANNVVTGPTGGVVTCRTWPGHFTLPRFSHNDVYDGTRLPYAGCGNPTGLAGNITVDPRFVDPSPTGGDYRLRPGSPAVDTGDNGAALPAATDLAGAPRIADGNGDGVGTLDMGAYELSGPAGAPPGPIPADPAPRATLQVPADQPTIQAGVDRVAPGGVVIVAPGTYRENLDFHGKAVEVRSSAGVPSTIIDGGGKATVVSFLSGEDRRSVLRGFTVRNGGGTNPAADSGIEIRSSSPTIADNLIADNSGVIGSGVNVYNGGAPLIQGNTVRHNAVTAGTSGGRGGGVSLDGSAGVELIGNIIEDNFADTGGGLSVSGSSVTVRGNTIRRNRSLNEGGGVSVNGTNIDFVQNLVVENTATYRGAALYGILRSSVVTGNTFAGNRSLGGTAIWAQSSWYGVVVDDNIFDGPSGSTVIACDGGGSPASSFTTQLGYNDLYNGDAQPVAPCAAVVGRDGNVAVDPRFVEASPVAPDYHLQRSSPLVDAGANDAPGVPASDLDGKPRVVDGDGDGVATIDPGVFEVSGLASEPVATWGWDAFGQLGDGTNLSRPSPGPEAAVKGVVQTSAGLLHTLDLQADGTVRASGWNGVGQLGDASVTDRSKPVGVRSLVDVVEVSAGGLQSVALRTDGTVWAWGWNAFGQLGDGTTLDRSTPVQVVGLTGVVMVSAGTYHSLALKADGTVWAWGWNGYGQLGDGTTVDRHTPVRVAGLAGVTSIAAGGLHSVASTRSGEAWAWGSNVLGALGTGAATDSLGPARVAGLGGVVGVSAGLFHTLAITADGTAWAWGWNAYGQLGDGTTADKRGPVRVATGPGRVRFASAGATHSLLLRDDGSVLATGWNGVGQLGDGSTVDRHVPVVVRSVGAANSIAAGGYHSTAS